MFMSKEQSDKALEILLNDECYENLKILNERLIRLKASDNAIKNSTICNNDANEILSAISQYDGLASNLQFKKNSLQQLLDQALTHFDIDKAVTLKKQLADVDVEINNISDKKHSLEQQIQASEADYTCQLNEIKNNYTNFDPLVDNIEGNYAESVVNDFKNLRAKEYVQQFIDTAPKDKINEILANNENLKGYIDVGENI